MTTFIALLRAVNVGGTGKLPMAVLRDLCEKAGLKNVQTYIASGNVVFESEKTDAEVKTALEDALKRYTKKHMSVFVRTTAEMEAVLARNPFAGKPPNKTVAIFLNERPPKDTLQNVAGRNEEMIELGKREIYVYYRNGMGGSKLRIPAAAAGTARNMNTVARLAKLGGQN
jgi:uncharacterized protein (DUF1697 family)